MRVGFPVIFMRDGVEYAGIVVTSSPRKDQVPLEDLNSPLTREQRFNELRCSIAFWDSVGWMQADNVAYLPIDEPIPAVGDRYSEVGAPDAFERLTLRDAQAEHARKMEEGRRAFEALPEEEKAKFRAANQARVDGQRMPQRAELAPADVRSPDPVETDRFYDKSDGAITDAQADERIDKLELLMSSEAAATEAAIDDELDKPIG